MSSDPRFRQHLTALHKHTATQRGVLYFSSVPTDMRPNEVRLHFQQFGEVLRQKFVPFTIKHAASGKRLTKIQFKEGWLEFKNKEDAVRAASMLNSQPVGVRRFRKAHGQTWNVKYLPDFSWDRLIEDKETSVRERKFREFKEKESERNANEMFRALVAAKSRKALGAKRTREEEPAEATVDEEAVLADETPMSVKKSPKRQVPTSVKKSKKIQASKVVADEPPKKKQLSEASKIKRKGAQK